MEVQNKLFEQIKDVLQEQKMLGKKLISITKKLNVNEQQLNESSNFLLSTSKQLFTNKIELLKEKKITDDLFETANVIIVTYDTEGYIQRFNAFAEELSGYKEAEVIGKNWIEFFIPEQDKAEVKNDFSEFLKGIPESNSIENRIICKDGTIKKIDWSCTLINDNKLLETYVLAIGIDISKRKKIEDTLTKERKLFSAGPVAVLTWLPESGWPVKHVSSNIEKILGYTVKEMTSPNFDYSSLIHADDIVRISDEVRYNNKNNIDVFEQSYRLKHKSGQYRWFYDFTNFIRDEHNNLIEVRGYMFDQTVLKQSEYKILSQKQRLNNIIEATNLGTWEWNVISGEVIFNEQWASIIGYTLEELSPISINAWNDNVHPDDLEKSNEALQKHFNGEEDYYSIQCRMKHKDGHWVWVLDRGKVIGWTKDGRPEWMFGTHQDINKSKQIEMELKTALKKAADMIE